MKDSYQGFKVGQQITGKRKGFKTWGTVIKMPYPMPGSVPVMYEFKDGPVIQFEMPENIK